jgi:hypothetical protein
MLRKLCTAMTLIVWLGCSAKEIAPAQLVAPATAAPSTKKLHKPTLRQVMPRVEMKVAPTNLVKPTHKIKLQYKMLLPRPTKSAI